MKSYIFSIVSAALFVAGVSAQVTINTPTNVAECAPLQISFSGATCPCIITVYPGATPNGNPLTTFTNVNSSPFTWSAVNFASGTSLDLSLRDSTGASAQSAPFTVQAGGSTSCLNGTASGSSGPAQSTAANPTNGAATATGTTPGSTATNSGSGSGSTTSKAAASPSASKSAAIIAGIPYSVAGVLGVVIAAVFV